MLSSTIFVVKHGGLSHSGCRKPSALVLDRIAGCLAAEPLPKRNSAFDKRRLFSREEAFDI